MKPFNIVIAVAVIIACFCISSCTAVPFSEVQTAETWKPEAKMQDFAVPSPEDTNPLALFRTKRQSHLALCRYCCNCCRNKGCGYCCRF